LRPGEKLYEELLIGDNVSGTLHPRVMRANEIYKPWGELQEQLNNLQEAMRIEKIDIIKSELANLVDGYLPWVKQERSTLSEQKNIINIR